MFAWLRRRPVTLPADAELVLTGKPFVWKRMTIVVGRVECDELRAGDEVVLVGSAPVWRGRLPSLEQFQKVLESARRGEEVGVLFSALGREPLPPEVRLYRVPPGVPTPGRVVV
jgi:translation elongation factor EF-Tu-like GTPase